MKMEEDTLVIVESTDLQLPTIEHLDEIKNSLEKELAVNIAKRYFDRRKIVILSILITILISVGLLTLGWFLFNVYAFVIFVIIMTFVSLIIYLALQLGFNELINKRVDKLIQQIEDKLLICKICINCHYCTIVDDDYTTNVKKLMTYGFDPDFSQLSFSIAEFYREQYKVLTDGMLGLENKYKK